MVATAGGNKLALFGCRAYTTAVAGHGGGAAFRLALVVLEDEEVVFIEAPWFGRLFVRFHIAPGADGVAGFHLGAVKTGHGLVIGAGAGGIFQEVGGEAFSACAEAGPAEHCKYICDNKKDNSYSENTPAHL